MPTFPNEASYGGTVNQLINDANMCTCNVEINQYVPVKTEGDNEGLRVPLSSDNFIEASVGNVGTLALVDIGARVSCIRRTCGKGSNPIFFQII